MNNTLLIYWPIGPTFKDRMKSNLKTFNSYKFFDVLIATDDPEYFSDIDYPNVNILDLNHYRNAYSEFNEFECLPDEKKDSCLYREQFNELISRGIRFPLNVQRFSLLYENIDKYEAISILDCDMIPVYTEEEFERFQNYLKNVMPINSISTNRAYYTWDSDQTMSLLNRYGNELNKTFSNEAPLEGFDGLFKLYKFENSIKIKKFFETWNYIVLDCFKTNNHLIKGSWNVLIEEILAVVYRLENIKPNKDSLDYIEVRGIKSYNFPEDRYWDDWTHEGFDVSASSKDDFIEKNYEKLKNYYTNQGLKFTY